MTGRGNTSAADGANDGDGFERSKTEKRLTTKQTSMLSHVSIASDRNITKGNHIDRINTLKVSVNLHNDAILKILLTSKEAANKKTQIESAFHFCKEAFLEMATTLTCFLEARSTEYMIKSVKSAVREVMNDHKASNRSSG